MGSVMSYVFPSSHPSHSCRNPSSCHSFHTSHSYGGSHSPSRPVLSKSHSDDVVELVAHLYRKHVSALNQHVPPFDPSLLRWDNDTTPTDFGFCPIYNVHYTSLDGTVSMALRGVLHTGQGISIRTNSYIEVDGNTVFLQKP